MIDATTTLRGRKHLVEPEKGRDEFIMHKAMRVLDRVRDPGRGRDVGPGSQVAEEGERGPQPVPEGGRRLNLPPRQNRKGRGGGQQAREEEEIKQRGGKKDRTEAEKKEGGKRDRTEVEKKERQKGSRGERGREEEGKETT